MTHKRSNAWILYMMSHKYIQIYPACPCASQNRYKEFLKSHCDFLLQFRHEKRCRMLQIFFGYFNALETNDANRWVRPSCRVRIYKGLTSLWRRPADNLLGRKRWDCVGKSENHPLPTYSKVHVTLMPVHNVQFLLFFPRRKLFSSTLVKYHMYMCMKNIWCLNDEI